MKLTCVIQEVPEGYIAFIEEIPGVNTQGNTLEETKENLHEALELILETNREIAEEALLANGYPVVSRQRIAF